MDISEDELRKWTVPTLRNFLRSKGIPSSLVVIQLGKFGFGNVGQVISAQTPKIVFFINATQ